MPKEAILTTFLDRLAPVWQPHEGQREFLTHPAKIKVLACGRRWGKTDASAARILYSLFQNSPARHILLAPTLDQASLLFERTVDLLGSLLSAEGLKRDFKVRRSPYPRLEFGEHRVAARSGHLGRSLRGNEATDIIVDEAAYVPEDLITEVAMPMLATTEGSLTLISTPRGLNHFWRFFRMGQEGEHGIWSRQAPTSESPFVSDAFLEIQRGLITERAFRTEYGAEFVDLQGKVFRTEAVDACLVPRYEIPPCAPYVAGVDWARYEDYTAVGILGGTAKGAQLVHIERFHGPSWRDQIDRVAAILRQFGVKRAFGDATGVGDPLTEELRRLVSGLSVEPFTFTPSSKASLIDRLVWLFENRLIQMTPEPELLRELQHFEAKTTESGHRRLQARIGFHDDLVIALALAAMALPKGSAVMPMAGRPRVGFSLR